VAKELFERHRLRCEEAEVDDDALMAPEFVGISVLRPIDPSRHCLYPFHCSTLQTANGRRHRVIYRHQNRRSNRNVCFGSERRKTLTRRSATGTRY
jgi:hypothetical protein